MTKCQSGLLVRLYTVAPVVVELVYRAAFGFGLHSVGVPQHEGDANNGEYHPAEHPVFQSREERQVGDALCDTDGKGIEHGTGKAHMGRHIAHADAHNAVVAHLDSQRDEHHHESNSLLAHAEDSAEEAEEQHNEGDDDIVHA